MKEYKTTIVRDRTPIQTTLNDTENKGWDFEGIHTNLIIWSRNINEPTNTKGKTNSFDMRGSEVSP